MDKITTALLFEVWRYLNFRDMMLLTKTSKHYNAKMKDILTIFSEREAQRLLLSKWTLLRNPFIEIEQPLNNISEHNWFGFLKQQTLCRKWLRGKLRMVFPKVLDGGNIEGLTRKLFTEIKKPSESPPKLIKTNNSIALRTSFQALLYWHSDIKKNRNTLNMVLNENCNMDVYDQDIAKSVIERSKEFAQEITENEETIWLEDLRWYRSKHDVGKPPNSSILWLLFWFEGVIKCHWEVAHKIIQTKRNTENFLDEYGTRWVSYSDLIMSMEEEMWFLEDTINEIWPLFAKEEFAPRYSILRMMWRIWGKYVMKRLLPAFIDKIKEVLGQYHGQIYNLGLTYKSIMLKKYGANSLKHSCSMKTVTRDLLMQSIQMIVDVSLNEISINYLESTNVQLGKYYSQVEEVIVQEAESFLKQMAEIMQPEGYAKLTSLYFVEIRTVFPKTTRRKIHELVLKYQIKQCEKVIHKSYREFWDEAKVNGDKDKKTLSKPKLFKKFSDTDYRQILGKQQDERISHLISDIVHQRHHNGAQNGGPLKSTTFEEDKIESLIVEQRRTPSMPTQINKEKAANFYMHVMTTDKEIVMMLNKFHGMLSAAIESYDNDNEIIQNDNINRRIPEHLEDEDK